ncbi:MAG: SHOCT domain-containing protein [Desulfobacterales bacterium]|nr:SHOCT domain-containing protein [Desulfobacterales bacterium]
MTQKTKNESEGLFKGVMLAYLILILHVLLVFVLGFLVLFFRGVVQYMPFIFLGGTALIALSAWLFFRKLKREGRTLKETLRSSTFQGRPVQISLMGGMASLKIGSPGDAPAVESLTGNPARQLEDPATLKIRELSELARLLENDLITQDEFELAKGQLLNLHTISNTKR